MATEKLNYTVIAPPLYSVLSILFALIAGGIILLFIGKNPFIYFGQLFAQGMGTSLGVIESIMARLQLLRIPQLLVGTSLLSFFSLILMLR